MNNRKSCHWFFSPFKRFFQLRAGLITVHPDVSIDVPQWVLSQCQWSSAHDCLRSTPEHFNQSRQTPLLQHSRPESQGLPRNEGDRARNNHEVSTTWGHSIGTGQFLRREVSMPQWATTGGFKLQRKHLMKTSFSLTHPLLLILTVHLKSQTERHLGI